MVLGFRLALTVIGGLLHAVSMAWPFAWGWQLGNPVWFLQILGLAILVFSLLDARSQRAAAGHGWLFGCVALCATFWWLYVAMHTFGGLPAWMAVIAVWALAAPLALYYAAAAAVVWRIRTLPAWFGCACAAAAWMMAEMARGIWFTGFGWGGGGYAHVESPLSWLAPWLGVYGIAAAAMLIAAAAVWWLRQRAFKPLLIMLGVVWILQWAQSSWTQSTGSVSVALLQGNIPQDEKFETGSGVPLALQWYREQLLQSKAQLMVAPETAIPLLPQQLPPGYWEGLLERFANSEQSALIGIPLGDATQGYTNSVLGLGAGYDGVWQYHKHHLVPFGEFIPPFFRWFTAMMHIPLGDFERGALGQPSFAVLGQRFAPNICYEDLFGEELAQRFKAPELAPTVFVNVSNMGWFGDNASVYQHLHISRMRALEFERPFVRATNTGATAVIDHRGRVTAALSHYVRDILHTTIEGRDGLTPYAWWVSRWGLWPLWLLGVGVVLLGLRLHRRHQVASA